MGGGGGPKGGSFFVDITNEESANLQEFSNDAPKWRVVNGEGLCLEGKCTNSEC